MTALLSSLLVAATGCSTIERGSRDELRILSRPSQCQVVVSGDYDTNGTTPMTIALKRRGNYNITISKEGYDSQTVRVESKTSGKGVSTSTLNLIIGGVVGVGIDAYSGAWYDLKPNPVVVELNKTIAEDEEDAALPDKE